MSKDGLELNIVNDNDEIIGKANRKEIHDKGLLHHEVHVWFVTPDGKVVFQHRAKDKDTFPDLLDATVGGHVELGATYEDTAVKETKEETGMDIQKEELILLRKIKNTSHDDITKKVNYAFKVQYLYIFKEKISDLHIEEGKAIGFEMWNIDDIIEATESNKKRFIPGIFATNFVTIFGEIKKIIQLRQ